MDSVESPDERQPTKRARATNACQSCRAKKLSCSGSRPCARCRQDGRECADAFVAERTPLTRKRMTEYEDRLVDHGRIWAALFPQLSLETACDWLNNIGLDATVQKVRTTCGLSLTSFAQISRQPSQLQTVVGDTGDALLSSPSVWTASLDNTSAQIASQPASAVSPQTGSVRIPLNLHDAPYSTSHAWNEDNLSRGRISTTSVGEKDATGATPGHDFGTGVRADIGYMGLSSAATLLRAIQKFAPEELLAAEYGSNKAPETAPSLNSVNIARISGSSMLQGDDSHNILVLPPYNEVRPLVDAYFQYFHALTPIVHEPTIRAQLTGAIPLPKGCGSRVLFNMIFATGAFDSALEDDHGENGMIYYEEARAALQQDLLEGGSLILVQGLAIMAIWLQRCNKPNAGYVCLGLAIRMATALGVHVSAPSTNTGGLTVLEAELRNRIWWSLVTLEGGQCMTYGRPHGFSLPSLSAVRLPINIDDDRLTVSTIHVPDNSTHVTLYTALVTQARLAQIVFHSLDQISRSLPCPTADQIKECGNWFREQLKSLPAYMQPDAPGPYKFARRVQVWRCRDYQSILYRPVLLAAAWHANGLTSLDGTVRDIINDCQMWAIQTLHDIAEFVRTDADPHRGCEWYMLYFGIQASLTILLSIVSEPDHASVSSWRGSIELTIAWLYQLGSMKELGISYARIMEKILSLTPSLQVLTSGDATSVAENGRQTTGDFEKYDFERYFSEIWEGQPQYAGMTGDIRLGTLPDVWDDMITGL